MEILFLHKENPAKTDRNAKGKRCNKNSVLLREKEKGLFPLAEAQKKSKSLFLQGR